MCQEWLKGLTMSFLEKKALGTVFSYFKNYLKLNISLIVNMSKGPDKEQFGEFNSE